MDADDFEARNRAFIDRMAGDSGLRERSREWLIESARYEYSHHFTWLGRPIIQFPPDIIALQEIIWRVKPSVVVETGIARGGSLVFSASMLELMRNDGVVIGIDIEIRQQNRQEIERHPLSDRIRMIEGSSVDEATFAQAVEIAGGRRPVLVILDSNHTHEHVARELQLYSDLVGEGSYLIVYDTIIEQVPQNFFSNRPWGVGNNPATAVRDFLAQTDRFAVDEELERKLLISTAPGGYLRCVKD
jgi:cephalosporin hydroxylase